MSDIKDVTDYLAKDAWSRRRFLQTTGLLAAGLAAGPVLEACGGGSGTDTGNSSGPYVVPKPKSGAKVQLLQWNSFVKAADDEFKRQAAEFNSKFGTQVTIQTVSGDDLVAKTPGVVEAGAGPDIIQMEYGWPHLYDSACVDVTADVTYLKSKLGAIHPVNDQFCKVGNAYRAIPYTQVPNAWSYRTDIWTAAGLNSFPTTWDEFKATGKQLHDKGVKQDIGVSLGHAYGDAITMWYPLLWDFGGAEATADGKTVTINSKETLNAVNYAIDIWKNGYINQNTLSWLDPDNNQAYHSGNISATLNGASIYLKEKNILKKYIDVTQNAGMPKGQKGLSTLNLIFNHAVMKWSTEQETARAFLLYAMDHDNYSKWMGVAGGYNAGPFAAFNNDPVWTSDPKLKPFYDVVPNGKWPGWPTTPGKATAQSQVQFIIVDMFAKAVTSNDAKGSIADAEQKLKRIYEKPS